MDVKTASWLLLVTGVDYLIDSYEEPPTRESAV